MKLPIFGWLALLLAIISCKTSSEGNTMKADEIIFGNGGGFTGAVHTYHLKKNGELFEVNSLAKSPHPIATIDSKKTKELFKRFKEMEIDSFSAPGNIYKFVGYIQKGQEFRITWGDPNQVPPARYIAMYDSLIAIVPKKHD